MENFYNDADFFFDSSTQQQNLVGRDHDRKATTDVLSNSFQELKSKSRIIIIKFEINAEDV